MKGLVLQQECSVPVFLLFHYVGLLFVRYQYDKAMILICTGDKIYKDLVVSKYLNVDDFPVKSYLYGQPSDVVFFNIETREWSLGRKNSPFKQELVTPWRLKFTRFLLFVMQVCIAVIPHEKVFYLLDSNCRDEKGLPVPYGTSVLLKFANASELERYLIEIYLQKNSVFHLVQFLDIAVSE